MCTDAPLCLFGSFGKRKMKCCFEDVKLVDQTLKSLFLCALLDWVRKSIVEILLFMVVFVDWLDAL